MHLRRTTSLSPTQRASSCVFVVAVIIATKITTQQKDRFATYAKARDTGLHR